MHQFPDIAPIAARLRDYRARGLSVFASSSFQSQSVPLLHILSGIAPRIPVYFMDTGYLFPETLAFRDHLADLFGLDVVTVRPATPKIRQLGADGHLLFASDPDSCCHLNKVLPMEPIVARHDVWVSGIRADQTAVRKAMLAEQQGPYGVLRYHPLLHWTAADIEAYSGLHALPSHPLDASGYRSIGCEPCTRRPQDRDHARGGRWQGLEKKECGLHTDLAAAPPGAGLGAKFKRLAAIAGDSACES
ncbi:phosphoadenylyl-sulfate reductase [Thiohalocapsa sp. ML1]|uniref:phosphoadenylyl-sulfate reductase n=1 Tax=Thiohalocapsa sp. ML1 TaxID=1431688 RepID=UPI0009EBE169|nr:phosphoadenylyl-sulfate reductase [Thiohalocapsa sp. ML1]